MTADWRQAEDTESHRWYAEHLLSERWACVYCGRELPEQHSSCCHEVGHTETLEASNVRWAQYDKEFNHDHR